MSFNTTVTLSKQSESLITGNKFPTVIQIPGEPTEQKE